MEKISINVDGNDFTAEFRDGDTEILVNNKPVKVIKLKQFTSNIFSFLVNNRMVMIELDMNGPGQSFINADGFYHEVEITNDAKKLIQKYLKETGAGVEEGHAKVKAPMPGMVIKILAEEGTIVKKGDKIIIIEAMKMENSISAPIDGKVLHVNAREGEAVEKESLLIEIEANNK